MFATIYLPNFYLQAALRHQPELRDRPIAVIDEDDPKAVIIQLNEAAENAGVHRRMTPSQGLARCLELVVKPRNRSQENQMQKILIEAGFSLSPYIESTAPGICSVQFTDPRNVENKASRTLDHLSRCDIKGQAGIANSPDASLLAAHLAKNVLKIDDTKKFLDPLPIETLSILTY